ncbi:BTB/POZ domain-containing protein At5g03250 [Elaeis guineensis]|uniref:BTB/POZ domain-containing protein At5g03250 n=1 Tax=Elaeis guineensis var. tenera TaxID=51953 RepID=A0A6I9R999_ELAGV|nr:BTB/POZ domain-containing protein At5g03250 [Elaeis guineensis]
MATMKLGSKADSFQLEGQTWICKSELASDVIIEIGEVSFHLHKFPLTNRSGLLQKMISEFHSEDGKDCVLQLHDIPGGAEAFKLAAKFCYDVKLELNALNVVTLRCAAEHLCMTEDYGEGNLIVQTENFLDEVFVNWSDSMTALQTCDDVLHHAEELQIVMRCIDSLATKACADPTLFGWPMSGHPTVKSLGSTVLWNGISTRAKPRSPGTDWWYRDVSYIKWPLYKRLILAMESKGMKPENIAGSLMHYAKRYLPGLSRHSGFRDNINHTTTTGSGSALSESDQKALLEEIVELLPLEKGATSSKFLLGLLRTAMILHASPSCRENLEKRVGAQLDDAALEDLLIPNLGYSVETLYDIDCVQRILDHFVLMNQSVVDASPCSVDEGQLITSSATLTPMSMVAKLVDGYLAEVASDVNLKYSKFQSLAAVVPDYARLSYDGLYRAIDIYLKSHPWLTDSEREQLCRLMNCQKLSLEACTHAAQNERLPLRVIVQVLFFEQLRLRTTIAGWFFAPDGMDNSHALRKSSDGFIETEIIQENEQSLSIDEMRSRVSELEKECSSMRQEIEKLGRSKSAWNFFSRKLGFGTKWQQHSDVKQFPVHRYC